MTGCILIVFIGQVTGTWPMWGGDPNHVSVQLMKGAITNNPVIKWRAYPGYPSKAVEWQFGAIADVNGDGRMEVLIGSEDNKVYCLRGTDGTQLWAFTTGDWVYSSPAVANVDGDPGIEVVVGSWDGKVYCLRGTDGDKKWEFQTIGLGLVRSSPAIADVDGDGQVEIVIGSNDSRVYCLTGTGGQKWVFTTGGSVWSSPAIGNVDTDGQLEIVVGSGDGKVYCISGTGGQKWAFATGGPVRSSPAIADLDRDGEIEIVVGSDDKNVYCLRGANGNQKWAFTTGGEVQSSPSIADVDWDGEKDVLIGSLDCKLYCLRGSNGNKKWEYMAPLPSYVHLPGALVDIDGDGYLEYLLSQIGGATLYCINAENGTLAWQITLAVDIHSPFAGDIDGDNCSEIIVGTNSADGWGYRVFAIDDQKNSQGCGPLYEDVEEDIGKGFEFRAAGQGIYLFMPQPAQVSLRLYDAGGRLVQGLYDGVLTSGGHTFNPNLESKGVYMVLLRYQERMKSLKIVK